MSFALTTSRTEATKTTYTELCTLRTYSYIASSGDIDSCAERVAVKNTNYSWTSNVSHVLEHLKWFRPTFLAFLNGCDGGLVLKNYSFHPKGRPCRVCTGPLR